MFDFFGTSRKLQEMDKSVSESFARVRDDTQHLQQWVAYLWQQNRQLQEQNGVLRRLTEEQKLALNELKVTIHHLPKTHEQIRELVETHFDWKPLLERVRRIEQKIDLLESYREQKFRPLEVLAPSVSAPVQKSPPVMREKLLKKLAKNSKEYVRKVIQNLVHKYGRISAMQLREMVVEEQGLCSKSTFYRILEEMEREAQLARAPGAKQAIYVVQ